MDNLSDIIEDIASYQQQQQKDGNLDGILDIIEEMNAYENATKNAQHAQCNDTSSASEASFETDSLSNRSSSDEEFWEDFDIYTDTEFPYYIYRYS